MSNENNIPGDAPTPAEPAPVLERGQGRSYVHIDEAAFYPAEAAPVETPVAQEVPSTESDSLDGSIALRNQYEPSTTVEQNYEIYSAADPEKPTEVMLNLPSMPFEEAREILQASPSDNSPARAEWAKIMAGGWYITPRAGVLDGAALREGAQWKQAIKSEAGPLGASRPKIGQQSGPVLNGERALLRVRTAIGLGGVIQIPLWHSGFWISIKTPTEAELIELERKLSTSRIELGRRTRGAIFSNESAYACRILIEFIQDHLHDTTLQSSDASLAELIQTPDIHHAIWGQALSIWPNGFDYRRSVFGLEPGQDRIITERLALSKLQWIDSSQLTPWQIAHMAKRSGSSMSKADVERYRSEFTIGKERRVTIQDDEGGLRDRIDLMLRVPSAAEHFYAGSLWIDTMANMAEAALGMNISDGERNEYVNNMSKATRMRQLGHWVKEIYIVRGDEEVVINNREDIDNALDELSQSDEISKNYLNVVNPYIEDCSVAVIAVTTVHEKEERRLPRFPHLIPIDAWTTFFLLLSQKIEQILQRD